MLEFTGDSNQGHYQSLRGFINVLQSHSEKEMMHHEIRISVLPTKNSIYISRDG